MTDDDRSSVTTRRHWHLVATADDEGQRLDQTLARHCQTLSRTQARRLIEIGGVHLAGRRVRSCSRALRSGETIDVYCDGLSLVPYRITEGAILYRDRAIIALDKPAGIETQPTPARYQGTLFAALQELLADPFRPHDAPSIGMVQRLDRETSGVILFSISPRAHKPLTAAITSRALRKGYLALVSGEVPPGDREIVSSLARCRDNRVRSVARGGQSALTRYRLVAPLRGASLVEVEPVTGRMHQIRAHLAEAGFPLLGDPRYDGPQSLAGIPVPRHMLHARRLELLHPLEQTPLLIEAPLPADFQALIDRLGLPDHPLKRSEDLC